jgi:transposase InsO family protein
MIARIVKFSFSFHLIPAEVISDNGPQYSSREFQEFAKEYGLNIPPTHPTSQEHMEKHKEPSKLLRICGERTMIST